MGAAGLRRATEIAILNANYIAKKLESAYPILYRGHEGFVAHECILDTRVLKDETGITVDDIAKALDGLWLSCANHVLPGGGNPDGRTDRK